MCCIGSAVGGVLLLPQQWLLSLAPVWVCATALVWGLPQHSSNSSSSSSNAIGSTRWAAFGLSVVAVWLAALVLPRVQPPSSSSGNGLR
jgi:hypothetical protein